MMFTVTLLHECQVNRFTCEFGRPIYWISSEPVRFCVSVDDKVGAILDSFSDEWESQLLFFAHGIHMVLDENLSWEDQGIKESVHIVRYRFNPTLKP